MERKIVCIGTSLGTIWLFESNETNTRFQVVDRIFAHDSRIDLLDGHGDCFVSVSDNRCYFWAKESTEYHITRKLSIEGYKKVDNISYNDTLICLIPETQVILHFLKSSGTISTVLVKH